MLSDHPGVELTNSCDELGFARQRHLDTGASPVRILALNFSSGNFTSDGVAVSGSFNGTPAPARDLMRWWHVRPPALPSAPADWSVTHGTWPTWTINVRDCLWRDRLQRPVSPLDSTAAAVQRLMQTPSLTPVKRRGCFVPLRTAPRPGTLVDDRNKTVPAKPGRPTAGLTTFRWAPPRRPTARSLVTMGRICDPRHFRRPLESRRRQDQAALRRNRTGFRADTDGYEVWLFRPAPRLGGRSLRMVSSPSRHRGRVSPLEIHGISFRPAARRRSGGCSRSADRHQRARSI